MNKSRFIERIESELLLRLFDYIVPFLDKKIKFEAENKNKAPKTSNLENIINSKPKIDLNDVKEIESLLLKNLSRNVRASKKAEIINGSRAYSVSLMRQKSREETNNYSVSIKYEQNGNEDRLKILIKNSEKGIYSTEIINKNEAKNSIAPYSIEIIYENRYGEERLSITYRQQLRGYLQKHIQEKEDMSNRVPLKWLNILPETMMGGVLGFTYLGENFMARRADLTGNAARMVDIHESIHTPDEYETICLTRWIMSKEKSKYIK